MVLATLFREKVGSWNHNSLADQLLFLDSGANRLRPFGTDCVVLSNLLGLVIQFAHKRLLCCVSKKESDCLLHKKSAAFLD